MGIELIPRTGHRNETVGHRAIDLKIIIELPVGPVPLTGLYALSAGNHVLQIDVGERQIVENGVLGGEGSKPGQEGEVFLFGFPLGVEEFTVGAIGALLYFGDKALLPSLGDVVDIFCAVSLAGIAAVSPIVRGACGGTVVFGEFGGFFFG